ncbi:MAG: hypothetical protein ACI4OX_03880 [Akkermansia sp.]
MNEQYLTSLPPGTTLRNLTRYETEGKYFHGWRVCISRRGYQFIRYVADSMHDGSPVESLRAAVAMRDAILADLATTENVGRCLRKWQRETKVKRPVKNPRRAKYMRSLRKRHKEEAAANASEAPETSEPQA